MANPTTLVLRSDVVSTVMADGAVLLDLKSHFFYEVNASGWAILQMFEAGSTPEAVRAQCVKWGANGADDAAIAAFLNVLESDGLVESQPWPQADLDIRPDGAWSPPTVGKSPQPLQRIMKSAFDPTLPLAE